MQESRIDAGTSALVRAADLLALVFCAGLAALYVSPHVLDPDEAIVATMARRIVDFNLPVYEAGWEPKPPLLFWLYAGVFRVLGTYNFLALHVLSGLAWVVTGLVVGIGARRLLGPRAFAPAVIAFALLRSYGGGADAGQAAFAGAANFEAFASPFLAVGLLLLLTPGGRTWTRLAGGITLATAASFKPPFALFGVAAAAATLVVAGPAAAWRTAWAGAAGAACVFAAVALPLWLQGDLARAWLCNVEMPLVYMAHGPITEFGPRLVQLGRDVIAEPAPWTFAACGLASAAFVRANRKWLVAVAVLLVCGLYLVTLSGYFFRHYWWMVHPVLAVAVAAGWLTLVGRARRPALLWTARAAAAAIVLALWLPAQWADKRHLRQDLAYDRFGASTAAVDAKDPLAVAPAVRSVRARSAAGDPIFVWGWTPHLYTAADRVAASRFTYCDALSGSLRHDVRTGATPPIPDLIPGAWDRLFDDLARHPPRVLVDSTRTGMFDWAKFPLAGFPRLAEYVARHYDLVERVDGFDVYVRRGG